MHTFRQQITSVTDVWTTCLGCLGNALPSHKLTRMADHGEARQQKGNISSQGSTLQMAALTD